MSLHFSEPESCAYALYIRDRGMSFFVSGTEVCFSKRRHGREKKVCPPEQDLYVSLKKLAFIWYGKMIVNPCKKRKNICTCEKNH